MFFRNLLMFFIVKGSSDKIKVWSKYSAEKNSTADGNKLKKQLKKEKVNLLEKVNFVAFVRIRF